MDVKRMIERNKMLKQQPNALHKPAKDPLCGDMIDLLLLALILIFLMSHGRFLRVCSSETAPLLAAGVTLCSLRPSFKRAKKLNHWILQGSST